MMGELAAIGSALAWATSSIIMTALARRMHPLLINGLQAAVGAIFLGLLVGPVAASGNVGQMSAVTGLSLAGNSVLNIAVGNTMYINSLSTIGVARGLPITSALYPLLTFVLASLILDEAPTWATALGAALIIVGISFIVRQRAQQGSPQAAGLPTLAKGTVLACLAAASWAGGAIWLRAIMDDPDINPVTAVSVRMAGGATILWSFILVAHRPSWIAMRRWGTTTLALASLSGVVGNGLSSLFFTVGVQQAGAGKTALLGSTAPLFGLPMAMFFLAERPTIAMAAGTALTVAGIFLVVR